MNWRLLSWKDIVGALLVLAFVGGLFFAGLAGWLKKTNFGFDPAEWRCTLHAYGEPTCIKRRPQ
jgi:hypothetical protein